MIPPRFRALPINLICLPISGPASGLLRVRTDRDGGPAEHHRNDRTLRSRMELQLQHGLLLYAEKGNESNPRISLEYEIHMKSIYGIRLMISVDFLSKYQAANSGENRGEDQLSVSQIFCRNSAKNFRNQNLLEWFTTLISIIRF